MKLQWSYKERFGPLADLEQQTQNARGKTPGALNIQNVRNFLTLGELRTLTRLTQTHFLTLNFTSIAGYETGFAQR